MGKEKRPGNVPKDRMLFPSASQYHIPSKAIEGPMIKMHEKLNLKNQADGPGPGMYETKLDGGIKYSMGVKPNRKDLE